MNSPSAVLARAGQFGAVTRCAHGCVHVQVGHAAWSFTDEQYLQFVALVSESAANYESLIARPLDEGRRDGGRPEDPPRS